MQHLLARAVWDADAVRDDTRDHLIAHLGDAHAVLVIDETGDSKKGTATVGVQRQYTGTAGKIDNAQVAAYLAYASRHGHGLIDRELYLPAGWAADADRRAAAGVPEQVGIATKPELARVMLERALAAGVPASWVAADEVYGGNPRLRAWLETRALPYVLASSAPSGLSCRKGNRRLRLGPPQTAEAEILAARIPPERWLRCNAGHGAKGRRWYARSRHSLTTDGAPAGWRRWLLIRRNLAIGELAFYRCAGPAGLPLVAPGKGGRDALACRGGAAGRQGAVRPGRAPGPPLEVLVPVGDVGHAGVHLPGGGHGHRARPASGAPWGGRAVLQRDPAAVCGPGGWVWSGWSIGCAGRGGDAGTRPALRPVTTGGKPPSDREDHDLRLVEG
jgi:DDE superfamily endonuclease